VAAPTRHPALARLGDDAAYVIGIDEGKGRSKIGGDPDLPAKLAWPGKRMFVAQIAFEEVKPFDVSDWLPATGMLYYFASEDCTDNVALYSKARKLARRAAPDPVARMVERFYKSELAERRLAFCGAVMGNADKKAVTKLAKELGVPLSKEDYSARIFGEPECEPGISTFAPIDRDEDDELDYDGPYELALQLPFSNGFLYLGVPPIDLRRGVFERARATYWGT